MCPRPDVITMMMTMLCTFSNSFAFSISILLNAHTHTTTHTHHHQSKNAVWLMAIVREFVRVFLCFGLGLLA